MDISTNLFEKIENYLLGQLNKEAKAEFETMIAINPLLAEEVEKQRFIFQQAQQSQEREYLNELAQAAVDQWEEEQNANIHQALEDQNPPSHSQNHTHALNRNSQA